MKKILSILILLILLSISITSCTIKPTDIPITKKKPNNYYYTNLLAQSIKDDNSPKITLFEINLHKDKDLPKEGIENLLGFFKNIKQRNFINKPTILPSKPQFKMYIITRGEKYVINVYNEKFISIYPWDGVYSMDYIDTTNLYTLYNLYGLCKYYFK